MIAFDETFNRVTQSKNRAIEQVLDNVLIGDGPKYAAGIKEALKTIDILEVRYAKVLAKIQEKAEREKRTQIFGTIFSRRPNDAEPYPITEIEELRC